MRTALPLAALTLSIWACGDDAQAKSKCEDLVTQFCDRVVSCAVGSDVLTPSFTSDDLASNCSMVVGDAAHCTYAVDVTKDYGTCLTMSESLDCTESNDTLSQQMLFDTPAICQNVVLYQK